MVERMKRDQSDRTYKVYVTDSLRLIPQMSYMIDRWEDIGRPKGPDMTAEEIADMVISSSGLEVT